MSGFADVIDGERSVSQGSADQRGLSFELSLPIGIVVDDLDLSCQTFGICGGGNIGHGLLRGCARSSTPQHIETCQILEQISIRSASIAYCVAANRQARMESGTAWRA
jgi:hypothetical protein